MNLHFKKTTLIFLFFSFFVTVLAQENCGNATDDDGDGFIDCLDPDCKSNIVPNGAQFNTANNGSGGVLAGGLNDNNWTVSTGSLSGPYTPAVVMSSTPGTYYASSWPDCDWISHSASGNHFGNVDYYYKIEFHLPCFNSCNTSYSDSAAFCLYMDFFTDNSVDEIYINGVPQSAFLPNIPASFPYTNIGYSAAGGLSISLCSGWNPGLNVLVIKVSSGQPYAGFLAQNSTSTPPPINLYPTSTQNITICSGNTYTLPWGPVVSNAGSYSDTIFVSGGCDSIAIVNLTVTPPPVTTFNVSICTGNTYTLPWGPVINTAGSYSDTTYTIGGCDSIKTVNLTITPPPVTTFNITICSGSNYTLPWGPVVNTAGSYSDTTYTIGGCDSIKIVNLTVTPAPVTNLNASVCQGITFMLPWPPYTVANSTGNYSATLITNNGCDSMVNLALTILPLVNQNITTSICQGGTYQLPDGTVVSASGVYQDTIAATTGCDTLTTVVLNVLPAPSYAESIETCEGEVFILPDGTLANNSGIYTNTTTTSAGCDSIVVTSLTVKPSHNDIQIPNVFTPNNDGKNELFQIQATSDCIDKFTIIVYNRWGIKIFESNKVTIDWDGKMSNGVKANEGTYYYIITMKNLSGEEIEKSGFVTLLR